MSSAITATIIVTWNQTSLTLDCLAALAAAAVPLADVWVVDNGSEQPVASEVRLRFPAVHQLRLAQNQGFAGGVNAGVRAALAGGATRLFLLNNDALVEPTTLAKLGAALESDPTLAAVGPKVYYHDTARIIQSVGLQVDRDSGQARMLGSNERDHGQHDQPVEREALFGCALLILGEAWQDVGELWEPFFNYAEETDWCLRARRQGWKLRYIPDAVVWHRTSSSLGWNSPLKVYLISRNQFYLRRRHRQRGWRGLRGLCYALYVQGRTLFRYLRHRQLLQARAILLALWDVMLNRVGNSRTPTLRLRRGEVGSREVEIHG